MKVSVFSVLSIALFAACVYDPPNPGPSYVYNCSDEAIYVYHKLDGKLDMKAPLVLFEEKKREFMFDDLGCESLFRSPSYRINAYEEKEFPQNFLLNDKNIVIDSLIFFFITEKTMKEMTWEEIVREQQYSKRIAISRQQYLYLHRVVTYVP